MVLICSKHPLMIYTHLHWMMHGIRQFSSYQFDCTGGGDMGNAINPMKIGRKSYGFMEEYNGPEWLHSIMRFQAVNGDVEDFQVFES